ncbi:MULTISPECIES: hypothetical protein [Pandoraea]|uniref:Uncharacterized protein n=1 Tax=Pandoraea communis TaxID=2508297 RepID=A0A5E4XWJ2_9BURK|nr:MULTISPECIES: hypothetical protein [Pandoraea]ALS66601.1 hypothetical protein AT395_17875 [Pandoraea apista]CFB61425.1 hypothetical protein LMG16407_01484 [Pandoraea apista]VVE40799.1 hypothetical protein PCO31110_04194 [Pandoraea communis]
MTRDRPALWLAVAATSTAIGISVIASEQRGGTRAERVVWVTLGVVLVLSAHLLPALVRGVPRRVRLAGYLLWGACMLTAINSHAYFFLFAAQHAAQRRAEAAPVVLAEITGRSLTVVMRERAEVSARLATANAQSCSGKCPTLEARRVTLTARLEALNAEVSDIRRAQDLDDRAMTRHDARMADPVTARLATLLGTAGARVDLLTGLAFASVLEGVACLLWSVALHPRCKPYVEAVAPTVAHEVRESHDDADGDCDGHAMPNQSVTPFSIASQTPEAIDHDAAQLAQDIAAGRLRPTVADIRRHLGCSQARAIALRRQIVQMRSAAVRNTTA